MIRKPKTVGGGKDCRCLSLKVLYVDELANCHIGNTDRVIVRDRFAPMNIAILHKILTKTMYNMSMLSPLDSLGILYQLTIERFTLSSTSW